MNVNPFSKKSAVVAKPVKGASPLNDIGDVSAVTEMFKRLRQQNAQYDQAIAALVAANRITCGWDKPAEPEMTLTIQREVLMALGDTDALARFDQEHRQALAQEQAARVKAMQQVQEAPTRVKALEQYINDLAGQMEDEYDQISVEREAERIFAPSARRMFDAAKVFVQAWREMQTVEAVLLSRIRLSQYSVTGEYRNWPTLELIGPTNAGELLPTLIEGISLDEIKTLNQAFSSLDDELLREFDKELRKVGFDSSGIKVYHAKAIDDVRRIYAPDPNPPKKHLDPGHGLSTVVRVDV